MVVGRMPGQFVRKGDAPATRPASATTASTHALLCVGTSGIKDRAATHDGLDVSGQDVLNRHQYLLAVVSPGRCFGKCTSFRRLNLLARHALPLRPGYTDFGCSCHARIQPGGSRCVAHWGSGARHRRLGRARPHATPRSPAVATASASPRRVGPGTRHRPSGLSLRRVGR